MDKISKNLQFCGIYMITNYVNNKRYIGSSKNIAQRLWTHRSNLRHNRHSNEHLQNAWNKYGEENFNFTVLEKCKIENQYEREQFYVDLLKPEYNICIEIVKNPPINLTSRQKHSETRKKLIASGIIPLTNNKPVYVYYKDGSFIGTWPSIRKAANALNIHYDGACRVIQGKDYQTKGYRFFTEKQNDIVPFEKPSNKGKDGKSKEYIVTNGVEIMKFYGRKRVAAYFGLKTTSISQYIKKKMKIKGKYMIYLNCRATE